MNWLRFGKRELVPRKLGPTLGAGFVGYFGRSGSHDKTSKRTAPATLSHDLSPVDLLFTGQRGRQMKVTPGTDSNGDRKVIKRTARAWIGVLFPAGIHCLTFNRRGDRASAAGLRLILPAFTWPLCAVYRACVSMEISTRLGDYSNETVGRLSFFQ